MSKITQDSIGHLDYSFLLTQDLTRTIGRLDSLIAPRTIFLLGLTAGLPIKVLMSWKWKNLLTISSDNDAIALKRLEGRHYEIPVHPRVRKQLTRYYTALGSPPLESQIVDSIDSIRDRKNASRIVQMVLVTYDDYWMWKGKPQNLEHHLQVSFGRRAFEVNGYTSHVAKRLKLHFKLRTNKELFSFLGYKSKKEIQLNLSSIDLTAGDDIARLEDRNFNNSYHFQRFDAFSRFLINAKALDESHATRSIRILLLLSVYNGVRPSSLLGLNWSDVVVIKQPNNRSRILPSCEIKGKTIVIPEQVRDPLQSHLYKDYDFIPIEQKMEDYKSGDMDLTIKGSTLEKVIANPELPVFMMNTNNRITQPSLSREIKKALHLLGFPHTDKMDKYSLRIMYGRKVLEIKGDHEPTIKKLKEHFKFRSKEQLFEFLEIDYPKKNQYEFEGKVRSTMFEEVLYDLPSLEPALSDLT